MKPMIFSISFLIFGTSTIIIVYGFYCYPNIYNQYLFITGFAAILTFLV
jgi:hypothetical protein